jgi:diguanylate cyclase (GGDEF)-like protein
MKEIQCRGFEAVLLDLGEDREAGIRNIRAIKQQNPHIAVIAIARKHDEKLMLDAIDSGAQECLTRHHDDGKVLQFAIRSSLKRKSMEQQFFLQANYDDLTGLPNARLFQEHMEQAIARAGRWNKHKAVMVVAPDFMDKVQEVLGAAASNAVLWEVANRMSNTLRKADLVCRYHGQRFALLLDDHLNENQMAGSTVAKKILQMMAASPFYFADQKMELSASIGIAIFPGDSNNYNILMEKAENACEEARISGGNHFCFA